METYTLNNGVVMPKIGFGTYQIPPEDTERCVAEALKAGYRCIDTAAAYFNEEGVGMAIKESGIDRSEIFVITKVWIQDHGYQSTKEAFETSLKKLQLNYIDLYLIHQPYGDVYGSWRAMEDLLNEGKVRAIGVCNFLPERLLDLIMNNNVVPAVNQIEIHPFYQREEDLQLLRSYKIIPQAWSPLAGGKKSLLTNKVISRIAKAHNKTNAQIILRWELQRGIQVIPKSENKQRIKENLNIFDFMLSDSEMNEIFKMDQNKSLFIDYRSIDPISMLYKIKIHEDKNQERYHLKNVNYKNTCVEYIFKDNITNSNIIKTSNDELSKEMKDQIQSFLANLRFS